eukprot:Blabericola_migrator_1__8810@NODE_4651_length_1039_cov_2_701646_g2893_i0_p2_GENE_NODE_4651_length_1039_cov_2_701646_g2893_i0NODE_4651_length_1039_cov_2_701646_g2893_i0_p2_ORF_typecomplete_len142_score22_57_NODE_4651_length_1039_cov_2_701646_g2893_i05751000
MHMSRPLYLLILLTLCLAEASRNHLTRRHVSSDLEDSKLQLNPASILSVVAGSASSMSPYGASTAASPLASLLAGSSNKGLTSGGTTGLTCTGVIGLTGTGVTGTTGLTGTGVTALRAGAFSETQTRTAALLFVLAMLATS